MKKSNFDFNNKSILKSEEISFWFNYNFDLESEEIFFLNCNLISGYEEISLIAIWIWGLKKYSF